MPNPTETEQDKEQDNASIQGIKPTWFQVEFVGCMEMLADARTTSEYFDAHQGWFRRCASPMKADLIAENAYALTVGRFGALGYELEPKIGLHLLPQEELTYRIETVPVPDYTPPGYEVDFRAVQQLVEVPAQFQSQPGQGFKEKMTRVEWHLDLRVGVCFPKFIDKLPQAAVKKTGDRLLARIVKMVSHRLTYKVQEDFHRTLGDAYLKLFKKRRSENKGRGIAERVMPPDQTADIDEGEDFSDIDSRQ